MTEEDFLRAIRASPADSATRLVYSDWLEEQGQPSRAEIVRAEVELARLPRVGTAGELLTRATRKFAYRGWRHRFNRPWVALVGCAGLAGEILDTRLVSWSRRRRYYLPCHAFNLILRETTQTLTIAELRKGRVPGTPDLEYPLLPGEEELASATARSRRVRAAGGGIRWGSMSEEHALWDGEPKGGEAGSA